MTGHRRALLRGAKGGKPLNGPQTSAGTRSCPSRSERSTRSRPSKWMPAYDPMPHPSVSMAGRGGRGGRGVSSRSMPAAFRRCSIRSRSAWLSIDRCRASCAGAVLCFWIAAMHLLLVGFQSGATPPVPCCDAQRKSNRPAQLSCAGPVSFRVMPFLTSSVPTSHRCNWPCPL